MRRRRTQDEKFWDSITVQPQDTVEYVLVPKYQFERWLQVGNVEEAARILQRSGQLRRKARGGGGVAT